MTLKHWTIMVPVTVEAEDEKTAIETVCATLESGMADQSVVGAIIVTYDTPKEAQRVTEFEEDFVDAYSGRQYSVSLNIDMNGDGEVTGCWISTNDGHSASLAALQDTGKLEKDGSWYEVDSDTTQEIADWAEQYGY